MTRLAIAFVWCAGFSAACSSSTETADDAVVVTDVTFAEIRVDTTAPSDTTPNLPPDFGDACSQNTDCSTGLCVEGPSGLVCSMNCIESCPSGWDCRGVQMGTPDIAFVCVPTGVVNPDVIEDTHVEDTFVAPDTHVEDTFVEPDTHVEDTFVAPDTHVEDTFVAPDTFVEDTFVEDTFVAPDTHVEDTLVAADTFVEDTFVAPDTHVEDTFVADTGPTDTTEPPLTGNACLEALGPGGDDLFDEASAPAGDDFPDCVTDCPRAAQTGLWEIDLRQAGHYTGALGGIDDGVHEYTFDAGSGDGPDIDVIAIRADPRTMIEFAVQKDSAGGLIDPVVYVSDGFAVRTYNSDVSPTNLCARTSIAFPFVSAIPIFVAIEDAENYALWTPDGYLSGTVGGASYGYTLRIRTGGFAPFELGTLTAPSTTTRTGHELTVGGETRYYRFYAPGTVKPTVTVKRAAGANAAFVPAVAGMKTIAGELVWQRADYDSDGNGTVIMNAATAFRPCVPAAECPQGFSCPGPVCTNADAEFIFAVFDWNGAADPGAFTYDVTVTLP